MGKKMYTKMEKIGPEMAALFLEYDKTKDDIQRAVSPNLVQKYAKVMKDGKWKSTPEPIAFDWDGNLINGQHRLHAVVESGCTIEFMVAYDCDPSIFDVIDQGKVRTGGDLFTISYKKRFKEAPASATHVAAVAARMLQRMREHSATKPEVAEHAMKHYKLVLRMAKIATGKEGGSTAVCAAFCNATLYFGSNIMDPLADRYISGMWASQEDPLKALFERIVRSKIKESRQHVLSKGEHYGIAVAAIRGALLGAKRPRLQPTARDFGEAPEDKKIRAGERAIPSPEPIQEGV